ncbi:hypothetical protein [Streptomyces sp. NPDC058255]|uniref:hypothetical protein n=1 Tax=Streptomyces sp. NPDC058255 TaxID=3346407 RepID=UPI0036E94361
MIETSTPVHEADGDQTAERLNHVLYNVIPDCLTDEALGYFIHQSAPAFNPSIKPNHVETYLFHVESGMRIYELYALLDEGDVGKGKNSLGDLMKTRDTVNDYSGPWALATMGGAGGQTIAGAFSTGTHGGDIHLGPLADLVVAVHLVDANGEQHWIERTKLHPTSLPMNLIDEDRLRTKFPDIKYFHRSDDLMNAVTVACGRMGVIYSVVLGAVRQYALAEQCTKEDWTSVKKWLNLTLKPPFALPTRFLQIDINAYGDCFHPSQHDCYIVTRVLRELDAAGTGSPMGRAERGGKNAGKRPALGKGDGAFSNPCASDNYIRDALNEIKSDLRGIREKAMTTWLVCAGIIVAPLTPPPVRAAALAAQQVAAVTIAWTTYYMGLIDLVASQIQTSKFGDTLAFVIDFLTIGGWFFIVRWLYTCIAESASEHNPAGRTPAISYATMDTHDYLNLGCVSPGDSVEIFFDATDPNLINFIDLVLVRIRQLENGELENGEPAAYGGYISLRFTGPSSSDIAMQQWPITCSVEIGGLSHVNGTQTLLKRVEQDAVDFGAILHWGQRNNWTMDNVETSYSPNPPYGALFKWRAALSELTDHGRYDIFSTRFSKQMGLEITDPIIPVGGFLVVPTYGCVDEQTTVTWEAIRNPPETRASLIVTPRQGNPKSFSLDLSGSRTVSCGAGWSTLSFVLERDLNGRVYRDQRDIEVQRFADNDEWNFEFTADTLMLADGVLRWGVDQYFFSQFFSNRLRVAEIRTSFTGVASWFVRNPDVGDLRFTTSQDRHLLPSLPILNKSWLFFSEMPGVAGPNPVLRITYKLVCES